MLKSSSGAAVVLVEHVFERLLGTLHPHVSGECDNLVLYVSLGTVLNEAIDSETSAGCLVDK